MDTVPSVSDVRAALLPLTLKQIVRLSEMSGVPWSTIYKIQRQETRDPGIETVRRFLPFIDQVR